MQSEARMALEPGLNLWVFMGAVVIQHQVELQLLGKLVVELAQKSQELLVAMSGKALADDFAFQDLQGGKQRRGPVADIIVSKGAATTFLERQTRLSAIQGLNLALFIDTQDQTFVRRIEVKPDHIGEFFQELFVPGEFESVGSVGLEVMFLPQPVDGAGADTLGARHRPTTPMSRTPWFGLQSGSNYGAYLLLIVAGFAPSTWLDFPYPL